MCSSLIWHHSCARDNLKNVITIGKALSVMKPLTDSFEHDNLRDFSRSPRSILYQRTHMGKDPLDVFYGEIISFIAYIIWDWENTQLERITVSKISEMEWVQDIQDYTRNPLSTEKKKVKYQKLLKKKANSINSNLLSSLELSKKVPTEWINIWRNYKKQVCFQREFQYESKLWESKEKFWGR